MHLLPVYSNFCFSLSPPESQTTASSHMDTYMTSPFIGDGGITSSKPGELFCTLQLGFADPLFSSAFWEETGCP